MTTIYSGHKYFGVLKKGKFDVYLFHNWVSPKTFNANLRVLKGKVSILYSNEKDFKEEYTKKLVHNSGDEFFSVECGGDADSNVKTHSQKSTRFFKILAEEDSSYEFSLQEKNAIIFTSINTVNYNSLISGTKHRYSYFMDGSEDLEIDLNVKRLLDMDKKDYTDVSNFMADIIRVSFVASYWELHQDKHIFSIETHREQFGITLKVRSKAKKGFFVVEVRNIYTSVMYYQLTINRDSLKSFEPLRLYADEVVAKKDKVYQFEVTEPGSYLHLRLNQCFGETHAYFGHRKFTDHNQEVRWEKFGLDQTSMSTYLKEKGLVFIKFSDNTKQPEGFSGGLEFYDQVPGIFTFDTFLSNDMLTSQPSSPNIAEPASREVTVSEFGGTRLKFLPVEIVDWESLLEDHNVVVNYTVYYSENWNMVNFMKACDNYDNDYAKKLFSDPYSGTQSLVKYYGKTYDLKKFKKDQILEFQLDLSSSAEKLYAFVVA